MSRIGAWSPFQASRVGSASWESNVVASCCIPDRYPWAATTNYGNPDAMDQYDRVDALLRDELGNNHLEVVP